MCLSLFTLLLGWGSLKVYFPLGTWEEPSGESIKLLTYNVEGFPKEEGDEEHSILKYLKESGADIICLQEFRTDGRLSLKKINKVLADYPYYKHTPLGGGSQLACYSRYPILSSRKINYKSQANGSVLYRLKMGKDTLILINNHLESNKLTGHDKEVYHDLLKSPGGEAQEGENTCCINWLRQVPSAQPRPTRLSKCLSATRHVTCCFAEISMILRFRTLTVW